MSEEPVEPRRARGWAMQEVAREDLELMAVVDLEERIEALQAEIVRTRAQMERKKATRSAADALFGKPG